MGTLANDQDEHEPKIPIFDGKLRVPVQLPLLPPLPPPPTRADMVDHPPHYRGAGGMEAIDVIEAFGLDFNLGNAVKYILRAGRKGDPLEDLRKASWYIARKIRRIEESR